MRSGVNDAGTTLLTLGRQAKRSDQHVQTFACGHAAGRQQSCTRATTKCDPEHEEHVWARRDHQPWRLPLRLTPMEQAAGLRWCKASRCRVAPWSRDLHPGAPKWPCGVFQN